MTAQALAAEWSAAMGQDLLAGDSLPVSSVRSSSSSLASSGSSSGSLGALSRCSSGSDGRAAAALLADAGAAVAGQPPDLAAPVACRAADEAEASQLLPSYSCFDGLHGPQLHLAAAAGRPLGGPPPDVLLAALSASLAAQQQHLQQASLQGQQQGERLGGRAPLVLDGSTARPAFACAACCCAFTDAAAYHQHCASLDHTMLVLQRSLALRGAHTLPQLEGHIRSPRPHHANPRPSQLPPQPFNRAGQGSGGPCSAPGSGRGTPGPGHPAAITPRCHTASPPSALSQAALPFVAGLPLAPHGPGCLTTCLDQAIDPQLDELCHALLKQMRQLDGAERGPAWRAAVGGKAVRRLVGGMREVRKSVKCGAAQAVIAAVDIQETNPCARCANQPGAEMAEIYQLAAAHGIPVVFALTRISLGSIFGANKRMSAVALTNVSGLEPAVERVLHLAGQARSRFALMTGQSLHPLH